MLRRSLPEGIEDPAVFGLVVAKHVEIAVVRADLKALVSGSIPLVQNFLHFKYRRVFLQAPETARPFIRLMPGITFNVKF